MTLNINRNAARSVANNAAYVRLHCGYSLYAMTAKNANISSTQSSYSCWFVAGLASVWLWIIRPRRAVWMSVARSIKYSINAAESCIKRNSGLRGATVYRFVFVFEYLIYSSTTLIVSHKLYLVNAILSLKTIETVYKFLAVDKFSLAQARSQAVRASAEPRL